MEGPVPPVTQQSVAAAKLAAAIERARIFEQTGILITDEGFILPLKGPRDVQRAS
jgi:hypothetical protein